MKLVCHYDIFNIFVIFVVFKHVHVDINLYKFVCTIGNHVINHTINKKSFCSSHSNFGHLPFNTIVNRSQTWSSGVCIVHRLPSLFIMLFLSLQLPLIYHPIVNFTSLLIASFLLLHILFSSIQLKKIMLLRMFEFVVFLFPLMKKSPSLYK